MMDKAYIIENNLIEQYLLGELTAEEQLQLELAIEVDPELKTLYKSLEVNFEKIAFENAIDPPAVVKSDLLQAVSNDKVVSIKSSSSSKFYLGIAASIAGFLLIGSIWMYSELNTIKQQLNVVQEERDLLLKDFEGLQKSIESTNRWFVAISDPDTKQYILEGNTLMPDVKLISYVNDKNKAVIINTSNLPELDTEHDYQMWADVEGEMINMGIIDTTQELLAMTYIENAESLNVTIEPAGGNDHPTVSRLVTNIYLN